MLQTVCVKNSAANVKRALPKKMAKITVWHKTHWNLLLSVLRMENHVLLTTVCVEIVTANVEITLSWKEILVLHNLQLHLKLYQAQDWALVSVVNLLEVLPVLLLTVHASHTDASVTDTGSEMETTVLNKPHCHWLLVAPPQTPHVLMVTVNVELTGVFAKLEQ